LLWFSSYLALQINKDCELVLQDSCCSTNCLFRIDCAVSAKINDQLVQVSTLLNTGALYRICHCRNRGIRGIQKQTADSAGFIIAGGTAVRWSITTPLANRHVHIQLTAIIEMSNNMFRINDFDIMTSHDIAGCHNTGTLRIQMDDSLFLAIENNSNSLEVEQDFNNVFLHTFDSAVLMNDTIDFDFFDGTAWHGRE